MSEAEQQVTRSLAALLDRVSDGETFSNDCDQLSKTLGLLERFIPATIEQVYDEWQDESIDGFRLPIVRKTGPHEVELIGLAILTSDQSVTPVHLRIQVCPAMQEIVWLEFKVGKPGLGRGGLDRIPYGSQPAEKWLKNILATETAPDIKWVYQVGFGQRQT